MNKHLFYEKQQNFWNSFAVRYDEFVARFAKKAYNEVYNIIPKYLKSTDQVLEIATGTGELATTIAPLVSNVYGLDYSEKMLQIAEQKKAKRNTSNVTFEKGDAAQLPYSEQKMDVVIAMNVFHLLPNPEKALREINRVLKNNGIAIIPTFCHRQTLLSFLISHLMEFSDFKVVTRWSGKSFQKFICTQGFELDYYRLIPGKIPLAMIVVRKSTQENKIE